MMWIWLLTLLWMFAVSDALAKMLGELRMTYGLGQFGGGARRENELPCVSVIIPARNEERNIGACVRSLIDQTYPKDKLRIMIVDDHSTDRTADIVREMQRGAAYVELVAARDLPPGWCGKNNACFSGAIHADGEWLCFIDADTVSEPDLLVEAVSFATERDLGLLSLNLRHTFGTFGERFLIPPFFFSSSLEISIAKANKETEAGGGCGQFFLFRKEAYDKIGGHEAVRGVMIEDVELPKHVKRSGYRYMWIGGERFMRIRLYTNISEAWKGLRRQGFATLRNGVAMWLHILKILGFAWLPLLLPLWNARQLFASGFSAFGMAFLILSILETLSFIVMYVGLISALRLPLGYALLFPLSLSAQVINMIDGWLKKRAGRLEWKKRFYGTPRQGKSR
ncbi:glycosyltransferase [Gordoniibacillus kamchatkensis]|uniref:glycosyltransferase n=1 Tax=Gordoniibacillus kamchatkensis TaxID=1590651 RepID=UPI000695C446|nr:glycosyltransferase [Paenibacillus sp. VKM B-2647]